MRRSRVRDAVTCASERHLGENIRERQERPDRASRAGVPDFPTIATYIIYMTPDLRRPRPLEKARANRGDGGLAQLVEHLLCKQGVNGSSPLSSTE